MIKRIETLKMVTLSFGHISSENCQCLGTKNRGLAFWELWANLPRITWRLVIWHSEKRVLSLFDKGHWLERTCLSSPLLRPVYFCKLSCVDHFPTPEKCKFLAAAIGLLVLWTAYMPFHTLGWLVGWLVVFLWYINLCRLFNARSILWN